MSHDELEDGVPVLNAVVESGNESIIQSSRLGREVLRELEMLQQSSPVKFVLQDHILEENQDDDADNETISGLGNTDQESQLALRINDSAPISADTANSEDEIELMIDEVVDRHIHELRQDIRRLITRLKQNT